MTSSVNSPEDVVNIALGLIGFDRRVGDIYEGTKASKIALDLYSQTRDEILRRKDWGFANRNLTLNLLKSAPPGGYGMTPWSNTYPLLPWAYEYTYPSDCIRLLYVQQTPAVMPVLDPLPFTYKIANDNSFSPPQRVILAQAPNLIAVYTGQITDMTTWEPLFVDTLAAALAKKFTVALNKNQQIVEMLKAQTQDEEMAMSSADEREEG